ncbi:MarR family winged helix-turn-helix transcriptional regulator [Chromohalobacter nigrandesensis]|uniref:MarR family winged helix-turn-helix transcriptional regulator n=1 Tax=Chromohalobacter nigrandesensis TaxID=119863 RepID=UPI001FF5CBAC|nr:MarR family transcriptional regulator [Chromohalobacter nigrandesensis]MCK0745150.1 MarR family transcriptional regulator [Chromohalobacter nigrandesensis]
MTKVEPQASHDASSSVDGAPETVRVAYLIGRLDRALRRHISEAVHPLGLTMQQYTALSVLARRSPQSNSQLAEKSLVSPQAANEMVKAMETKGLVERHPDPHHGRIIQIRMTEAGQQTLAECDRAVMALEGHMLESLSEAQRNAFQRHLKSSLKALGAGLVEPE